VTRKFSLYTALVVGIFVVYPACASVQRQAGTTATVHGTGGGVRNRSFDCDGGVTSTRTHRQFGGGAEIERRTSGAVRGGVRAEAVHGEKIVAGTDEAVAGESPSPSPAYGFGNFGGYFAGDYRMVGHEFGVSVTLRLDRKGPFVFSPWYAVRFGSYNSFFGEVILGSRQGLLLSNGLVSFGAGYRWSAGVVRAGVGVGPRVYALPSSTFELASSTRGGIDRIAFLEFRADLVDRLGLFASVQGGEQPIAVRLGLSIELDGREETPPESRPQPTHSNDEDPEAPRRLAWQR